MVKTLEEIWHGDFFERREEAENLEAYIESIWNRPNKREDSKGFVLAVDADYGMGKTFFLKKFKEQLERKHPVAYIDAWKDDLQDEPLIALLATLEEALKPYLKDEPIVENKYKEVIKKAQKVSGLMAKGIFLRALGALFTPKIVEIMSDSLTSIDTEEEKADLEETIADAEKAAIESASKVTEIIKEESYLRNRISKFREAQNSIEEMKKSLRGLVKSLQSLNGDFPPIIIIIDELDRCRPTYAIKLLEEVKHLFDVEGVVFVLGVNNNQISKSVKKLYGSDFAADSYLSRFFSRKYKLATPQPEKLIDELIKEYSIPLDKFVTHSLNTNIFPDKAAKEVILSYLKYYKISPRNYFKFFRTLETITASAKQSKIFLPQLMRLIIEDIADAKELQNFNYAFNQIIKFKVWGHSFDSRVMEVTPEEYFSTLDKILNMSFEERNNIERSDNSLLFRVFYSINNYIRNEDQLTSIENYPNLINFVQRIE